MPGTLEKIEEVEYYLAMMLAEKDDAKQLRYHLSAFLSAARAVLFIVIREARSKARKQSIPAARAWSDGLELAYPFAKPLIEYRDANLKERLVRFHSQVTSTATAVIVGSSSIVVKRQGKPDEIIPPDTSSQPPAPATAPPAARTVFPKWPGPEDLFGACQKIIDELRRIVDDGQRKDYLST